MIKSIPHWLRLDCREQAVSLTRGPWCPSRSPPRAGRASRHGYRVPNPKRYRVRDNGGARAPASHSKVENCGCVTHHLRIADGSVGVPAGWLLTTGPRFSSCGIVEFTREGVNLGPVHTILSNCQVKAALPARWTIDPLDCLRWARSSPSASSGNASHGESLSHGRY